MFFGMFSITLTTEHARFSRVDYQDNQLCCIITNGRFVFRSISSFSTLIVCSAYIDAKLRQPTNYIQCSVNIKSAYRFYYEDLRYSLSDLVIVEMLSSCKLEKGIDPVRDVLTSRKTHCCLTTYDQ